MEREREGERVKKTYWERDEVKERVEREIVKERNREREGER